MTFVNDAIRTERLLLRPLRPSDAEPLLAQFANWEVVRWLGTPPWPYTIDDARSFIAWRRGAAMRPGQPPAGLPPWATGLPSRIGDTAT